MLAKLIGISPSSPLDDKSSCWRRVRFPKLEGMLPLIELWEKFNLTKLCSDIPMEYDIDPMRLFMDKFIAVKARHLTMSEGTLPDRLLLERSRVNSWAMLPSPLGITPESLLLDILMFVKSPMDEENKHLGMLPMKLLLPKFSIFSLVQFESPSGMVPMS